MNIADLPNFGPKSQQMLAQAGIHTIEQLRELCAPTFKSNVPETEPTSICCGRWKARFPVGIGRRWRNTTVCACCWNSRT